MTLPLAQTGDNYKAQPPQIITRIKLTDYIPVHHSSACPSFSPSYDICYSYSFREQLLADLLSANFRSQISSLEARFKTGIHSVSIWGIHQSTDKGLLYQMINMFFVFEKLEHLKTMQRLWKTVKPVKYMNGSRRRKKNF